MEGASDSLYYMWFAILIFFLVILFVAKLKFDDIFTKREERRRILSYSKVKLTPSEEGLNRSLKARRSSEEQQSAESPQPAAAEQQKADKQ